MIRTFGLILAISLLFGFPGTTVAAQTTDLADAGIVFGDCSTPEFEYALTAPAIPTGIPIGSTNAVAAGESFSAVPIDIDMLIFDETAIVVQDESALPVACGPIGGVAAPDGSMVVGIAPMNGSGVVGVAYLLPDGAEVVVSLFLTDLDDIAQTTTVTNGFDSAAIDADSLETDEASSGVFTAEELAYGNELIVIMETMTTSLDLTTQLLDDPRPDEEQWNFDLILELVTWGDLQDRLWELTPPPSFAEIHQATVAAFALYDSAAEDLLRGIEENDSEMIQSGFVKWDLADELIGDASELVDALVDERQE